MTIFDDISDIFQQIEDIEEKLIVLEWQACTPKSGAITGMPKDGSGAGNPIELYLERKEKLEKKSKALKTRFNRLWNKAVHQMTVASIDAQTQKMMFYRFYKGLQWKACAAKLDKKYPNCKWNENKCFRKYREVLYKVSQFV